MCFLFTTNVWFAGADGDGGSTATRDMMEEDGGSVQEELEMLQMKQDFQKLDDSLKKKKRSMNP